MGNKIKVEFLKRQIEEKTGEVFKIRLIQDGIVNDYKRLMLNSIMPDTPLYKAKELEVEAKLKTNYDYVKLQNRIDQIQAEIKKLEGWL
jgi:uncharacterized protein YpuA (DUF1002 family)